MDQRITRRGFLGLGAAGAVLACTGMSGSEGDGGNGAGRLRARPRKPTQRAQPGIHELGINKGRDGMLSLPESYSPDKPLPLILMLHGALGRGGLETFCADAAKNGIAMLVPDSRGRTWDLMLGGIGPDIEFLDRALDYTFDRVNVDPRHLAVAGFSDGGSYALSIGLPNGDFFTHIVAFSPGYMMPPGRQGKPPIFISHGTHDDILPIEAASRRIVPQLKSWGYDVHYHEWDGGHGFTPQLAMEMFQWFVPG
jgi:predicted esterase